MEKTTVTIAVAELEQFCHEVLQKCGLSETDAHAATDVLVTTDTFGVFTHGVKALPGYVRRLRAGGLKADAVPRVEQQGPAWALVDGQSALGMVTSVFAMQTAIDKARAAGVAYVGVKNSCHFGAAGYYALLAAKAGLFGMAMANDTPSMVVPGAAEPCWAPIRLPMRCPPAKKTRSSSTSPPVPWPAARSAFFRRSAKKCPILGWSTPKACRRATRSRILLRARCNLLPVIRAMALR